MTDSKRCFKCEQVKPLSSFYKHKMMADGHLNKCKDCTKADTRKNYRENADYYKEYDRIRDQSESRKAAKQRYIQTPEGRAAAQRAKDKWQDNNVVRRAAHIIVGNAVRDRRLIKPASCESCGKESTRIHGHHDDYSKPLEVRWLCSKCHTEWHRHNDPYL